MPLKREAILQAFKTALEGITVTDGFNYTVRTVIIGRRFARDYNMSDYPLLQIDGGQRDREYRPETFAANASRNLKREWPVEIIAHIFPENEDARIAGEKLIDDIMRCIINDNRATTLRTAGADGIHLEGIEGADDFEVKEDHIALVHVIFSVVYNFTPGSL